MKRLIAIYSILFCLPLFIFSQNVTNVDYISPFHDGHAAVKKGDSWGFINMDGVLVVDYRTDLVLKSMDGKAYPIFNSGRALIMKKVEGISYFGFIDTAGNEVLKPQFLNATHFNDGLAIILKLYRDVLGRNDVLDKSMIAYSYMELAINPEGETIHYLSEKPTHITLSRDFMKGSPQIKSKFLSKSLIATKNENDKWVIKKV